jgi:hypothetical protein
MGPRQRLVRVLEQEKEVEGLCPAAIEQHVFTAVFQMIATAADSALINTI